MKKKRIYTVATAHLDTIWSWDFETTVGKYIYNTLAENISMLKKYPSYVFSFEGAYRYALMEEYYPELFSEMKKYIAAGRWNVTGSAYENGDVNCPAPEALFRNILIGNTYFDEKFGKRAKDIFLPDCFGFGWALPSIAHHANLKGFTTQKLAWGSAYGVPFDIGKWYGADGNYVYACLNPHDYYFTLKKLRDWDFVLKKLKENEAYGLNWTYVFHGIGDRGGAPKEASVKFVDSEIKKNAESDIEVMAAPADQIYRDMENELPQEVKDRLPQWKGELVMQNHGVGSYTSRAIGKRWNARCEVLAGMAELAGVMAQYFGAAEYNEAVLETAWKRVIAHQFHDDMPGTSVQRAYRRSWNDYALSMNQFAGETEASLSAFAPLMKSDWVQGEALMVANAAEAQRYGAVTARLCGIESAHVRVFDEKGKETPSQLLSDKDGVKEILFMAKVPPLGVRVYDVRKSDAPCRLKTAVEIAGNRLENQKYIVTLNQSGNISSILDKTDGGREILQKPIVFALFHYTGSKDWPAWEMNYKEANREPERIPRLVSVKAAETGPVRCAFEVRQRDGKSEFKSYICLTDGGETVEVYNEIEWQSMRTLCKNRFQFSASNKKATFDLGLGAIERGNMTEKLFEVPAQKWADITDESGRFGVSVLSECKYGWDKFNDNTLRLTAIHTPKRNYRIDSMQSMLDLGRNRYAYAIYSHRGKVGAGTQLQAKLFTQPMAVCRVGKHTGALGAKYSFGRANDGGVIVRAIKKPHHRENGEIIVRLNEGENKSVKGFAFTLGAGIESARELWASEEYRGEAQVRGGCLVCDFQPYEVKTFGLKLKTPEVKAKRAVCTPLALKYNDKIISNPGEKSGAALNIPRSLIPQKITACGTEFALSQNADKNALACKGQSLYIDGADEVRLLCTATLDSDLSADFQVDDKPLTVTINSCEAAFARWDLYDFAETAYIKQGRLGFEATHALDCAGNVLFAKNLYFWVVPLKTNGAKTLTLPNQPDIVILAATKVSGGGAFLAAPLYDEVENSRPFTFKKNFRETLWYLQSKLLWNIHDKDDYFRHNNNGKGGRRIEQAARRLKTKGMN